MSQYHHLSINEREMILILYTEGKGIRTIAREIRRSAATVSREIKRNSLGERNYSAIEAQKRYNERRTKCRRHRLLSNEKLQETVKRLFLDLQWSPEQISNRLGYENSLFRISCTTIYRGIYMGLLDAQAPRCFKGKQGAVRKLRHRGKKRHRNGTVETRGKIVISNRIEERPDEANGRQTIGHWEVDTLAGKTGSACLVTITDRCSRYLLAGKISKKYSVLVAEKMIDLLSAIPKKKRKSITPDRGKEFSQHTAVTKAVNGVQFYFADPHAPWQRGTNENTNGLLREYLPKSFDIAFSSDNEIAAFVNKINFRPRKCLGWKSPHEVFFNHLLHFI